MVDISHDVPQICVVGRTNFHTGIGSVAYAACELFSRYFPTAFYPVNSGSLSVTNIALPNGRVVPICRDLNEMKAFFFTDVIWNGEHDLNYTLLPDQGLKIAHVAYDSDVLPPRWVEILNNKFDCVYFSSNHLEEVAQRSGVRIPIGTLPIGLDIDSLLARNYKTNNGKIRFGSIAAFHQRKSVDVLVEAFLKEFGDQENVELIIHSNLAIGEVYDRVAAKIEALNVKNIKISNSNLSDDEKVDLIDSFDIFVNLSRGEGYSIGPREAMALGKALVLSAVGPHKDLLNVEGTFGVRASIRIPARYPEIDNQVFGFQYGVEISDSRFALRRAYQYLKEENNINAAYLRKKCAAEFSFSKLGLDYAGTLTPDLLNFKKSNRKSAFTHLPDSCCSVARRKLGNFGSALSVASRHVIPAHDGGFFSVFNVFMSHLVWDLQEDRCSMVLPDWDVGRLLERQGSGKLVSFCYGKPDEGNVWLQLFEPLYGLSDNEMNDRGFLYSKSAIPDTIWNEHREPLLTYVHAYDLYKSPNFGAFRKQYNAAYRDHVKIKKAYADEIDAFCSSRLSRGFNIAAHVKHPSHMIEQPGKCMAHGQSFIDLIKQKALEAGYAQDSDSWGVFLATDQDRVVEQFQSEFGPRVAFFEDVRRTKVSEDEIFDALPEFEKAREGHQVQHLVASNPENWSSRMAFEVVRDAVVMSRCDVLFHVVSNVSTAVSYLNPDIEMHFVD